MTLGPLTIVIRNYIAFVATLLLAGCGGGGSSGGSGNDEIIITPPPTLQSPGSHWFVLDADSNPTHFFISETGKIRATFHIPTVSDGPSFGAGMVTVTGTDVVGGNMLVRGIVPTPGAPLPADLSCDIAGTVVERQVLNVQVDCCPTDHKHSQYYCRRNHFRHVSQRRELHYKWSGI